MNYKLWRVICQFERAIRRLHKLHRLRINQQEDRALRVRRCQLLRPDL